MFTYQKTNRFFAQIAEGLEALGAAELEDLGAERIDKVYRGLYFDADRAALYRINYMSRLCSRVLAVLLRFDCHSTRYLYKTAVKLPWHELLAEDKTFAVSATVANSRIKHSQYAALCLKDAIVDYCRGFYGGRPDIDTHNPDVLINLFIGNNKAVISLDTSGGSLHRRGYRRETIEAPMQETVAAAVIRLTGWQGERPLYDPMCGSATILSEAVMHYCRTPAGFLRKRFGFENMPDFDKKTWLAVKKEAGERMRALPKGLVGGSDKAAQAVSAAQKNIKALPNSGPLAIKKARFQDIGALRDAVIVSNPPYGIRLGVQGGMSGFMKELGDFLKRKCRGSTAYLYFGKPELTKKIGLKPSWKKTLRHGGLAGVLAKYDMY